MSKVPTRQCTACSRAIGELHLAQTHLHLHSIQAASTMCLAVVDNPRPCILANAASLPYQKTHRLPIQAQLINIVRQGGQFLPPLAANLRLTNQGGLQARRATAKHQHTGVCGCAATRYRATQCGWTQRDPVSLA